MLILGDFNAVLQKQDRISCTNHPADTLHRQFVHDNGLIALDTPVPDKARTATYRKGISETPYSRIDDILSIKSNPSGTHTSPHKTCPAQT
jgi:hypothetical protein